MAALKVVRHSRWRIDPLLTTRSLVLLCCLAPLGLTTAAVSGRSIAETIAPNDNRRPAGSFKDGVLTIQLEARKGTWYPEGPKGVGIEVHAWG